MADLPDLPPEMLALMRGLRDGSIRLPPPPPNEVPSGIDARVINETVRALISERTAKFLTDEEIAKRTDKAIVERLRSIGLLVDEEHLEKTGEAVRSVLKWQGRWEAMWNTAIGAVLLAVLYKIAGLLGVKLPQLPGAG